MGLTPESLPQHELVGLDVAVVSASNPDLVGLGGEVIEETTKTLRVEQSGMLDGNADERAETRVFRVPKAGTTFAFALPDGTEVTVEGERLVARPARRTEETGDSQWR